MNAPAPTPAVIHEPAFVRRFEMADLNTHGGWLLKSLQQAFPEMTETYVAGWLRGLLYSNEHLFLYQDNAVALAQTVSAPGIKSYKLIQEQFVWVEDKADKQQLEDAADFYIHFQVWAQRQGVERMIVMENSDVPKAKVEERLGRLFDTKVTHARV